MDSAIKQRILELLEKREKLRAQKEYVQADEIRKELETLGYTVEDTPEGPALSESSSRPENSYLTIFGSGEISSIGRSIHEYVFERMGIKDIKIAIVSTPAGFQPNVKIVHEEIADFFAHSLANFHPEINIIYANTKETCDTEDLASQLEGANYLFLGPGSPTYALHHLQDTLLLSTLLAQIRDGASLCLSSAAAIAFSTYALPVYEIYKVGTDLYWEKGLDMYSHLFGSPLTVVPHFNNQEGGVKTDTSYCYMGKDRYNTLRQLLPPDHPVLGIDEQTAVITDLSTMERSIQGKGTAHES